MNVSVSSYAIQKSKKIYTYGSCMEKIYVWPSTVSCKSSGQPNQIQNTKFKLNNSLFFKGKHSLCI